MQRNNLLLIAPTAIGIAWAFVGQAPRICAKPLPPEKIPERTGVSNLALLSQGRPRQLPDSHRPFRKGETLRLVYPLPQLAEEVQPYG
ncbi:putative peptidase [Synechococcus sp. MIT S9220]|uniref:hypothetical protein n=1 Tax=unclassified Synechococcus TaxID=2626047 RepID=UPI0018609E37|nr:hypothetical protein [Synechococcus sp. MIT S9220]QNJ24306.1 putative peptidase [Synechococcus sp. MIT S9220]